MEAIEHYNPIYFIDIDETKQDRESQELKYGYSPKGENCIKDQILITNTPYSTISAVTSFRFLAWRIHEGNIDHEAFTAFMVEDVAPHILPENHLVLDNATCFALVKEWIRDHEDEATLDPVATFNRAFIMFQVGGERAGSIRGHWNGYFHNYEGYLANMIELYAFKNLKI